MTEEQAQLLVRMTHAAPPPVYLMVYNEMMQEPGLWAMFDKWDFKKMETLQARPDLARRAPSKKSEAYRDFFWDLVGGMYRASAPLNLAQENPNAWVFDQGVIVNPDTKQALINSPQFGKGIPQSVFYAENGSVVERKMPQSTLSYSVVVYDTENGEKKAMLMDNVLAESLLVKLYLFNGAGLKHFSLFNDEHDLTERTVIKTFEVEW